MVTVTITITDLPEEPDGRKGIDLQADFGTPMEIEGDDSTNAQQIGRAACEFIEAACRRMRDCKVEEPSE